MDEREALIRLVEERTSDKEVSNMNNKTNSDKSNSVDSFQRILSLAEFGVKRIEERRTVEFRIFISYITLLVLALYQLSKQQNSVHDFFKSIIQKDSGFSCR